MPPPTGRPARGDLRLHLMVRQHFDCLKGTLWCLPSTPNTVRSTSPQARSRGPVHPEGKSPWAKPCHLERPLLGRQVRDASKTQSQPGPIVASGRSRPLSVVRLGSQVPRPGAAPSVSNQRKISAGSRQSSRLPRSIASRTARCACVGVRRTCWQAHKALCQAAGLAGCVDPRSHSTLCPRPAVAGAVTPRNRGPRSQIPPAGRVGVARQPGQISPRRRPA